MRSSSKCPNTPGAMSGQQPLYGAVKLKGRTTCQVDGCLTDLSAGRDSYTGRYRVCAIHMVVSEAGMDDSSTCIAAVVSGNSGSSVA